MLWVAIILTLLVLFIGAVWVAISWELDWLLGILGWFLGLTASAAAITGVVVVWMAAVGAL